MNKLIIMVSVFAGAFFTYGQDENDVYRYSNTYVQGSPRFDAMGGAFGALGAESGCIGINPAGFGKYSVSALNFGINSTFSKTTSVFRGNTNSAQTVMNDLRPEFSSLKARMSNLSGVIVSDVSGGTKGFLYTQVFLGVNRVANFNRSFSYQGEQFESLLDVFCNLASGNTPTDLYYNHPESAYMAYQTYAINPDNTGVNYYPDIVYGNMYHQQTVFERGGINEFYFGLSTNYLDKLLFGASYSYNSLNYYADMIHKESLTDTTGAYLRSFIYNSTTSAKGGGSTVRIGGVYMPTEYVRFGLAAHSPTFYSITNTNGAGMTTLHKDGNIYFPVDSMYTWKYKYRLWTPAKFVGSIAFVFGDYGCVNVDVEYINYGWGRLFKTNDSNYQSHSFSEQNKQIKADLSGAINVRVGGEFVINNFIYLRGGYGYYPKGNAVFASYGSNYCQSISGGLGFRIERVYLDFSIKNLSSTQVYYAFKESRADLKVSNTTFNIGFQYKFDY